MDKPSDWIDLFYKEALEMQEAKRPQLAASVPASKRGIQLKRPPSIAELRGLGVKVSGTKGSNK